MNKRLRKKKKLGEFTELGFNISATLNVEMQSAEETQFIDDLIDLVESMDCCVGGGIGKSTNLYCTKWKDYQSCTDAERKVIQDFLEDRPEVISYEIEPLTNANSLS